MFVHPQFDPVAIKIGPLAIHWYGLAYLLAFVACGGLLMLRANKTNSGWTPEMVSDFVFYVAVGVILGGRLGYALFYNFAYYLSYPIEILYVWTGGMSFHGGLIGVAIAVFLFARKVDKHLLEVGDFIAAVAGLGLAFGRLANFINEELWGRVTDVPWAVVFPSAGALARHPSQLYQMLLEGLLLFALLWIYTGKPRPLGRASGYFLLGYSVFRFFVEFYREPDNHLGFVALDWLTMGQLLCIPMFAVGLWIVISFGRKAHTR